MGLLGYYVERGKGYYTITRLGARVLSSCANLGSSACVEELRCVFSSWLPYVVFSEFIREHGYDRERVVEVLGSEMLYWTSIMLKLGLPIGSRARTRKNP